MECDQEVAVEQRSAKEAAEMEVMRAKAEAQLARRESELHAAQDSILSTQFAPADNPDNTADDKELARTVAAIREVEERLSAMRHREAIVEEELRVSRTSVGLV